MTGYPVIWNGEVAGLSNQVASDDERARDKSLSAMLGYLLAPNVRLTFAVGREFDHQGFLGSVGLARRSERRPCRMSTAEVCGRPVLTR